MHVCRWQSEQARSSSPAVPYRYWDAVHSNETQSQLLAVQTSLNKEARTKNAVGGGGVRRSETNG